MEIPPSATMGGLAMPPLNGLLVHLGGQQTALHLDLVVLLLVAELVFGFAHQTLSATALQDQLTEVADSSAI